MSPGTLTIFSYDPETGAFTGPETAYASPAEVGVFHIPANATKAPPPAFGQGQIPVWHDDAWTIVPDLRGATIYDTATRAWQLWLKVGELPNGFTTAAPTTPADKWNGAKWVSPTTPFDDWNGTAFVTDVEKVRQNQIALARSAASVKLMDLHQGQGYLLEEVATWPQQIAEAKLALGGKSADTPLIDALAAARGVDKADLAKTVIAKAGKYAASFAAVIAELRTAETRLIRASAAELVQIAQSK